MTNKEAKEKLYMEWQKFLEDNIDYAGVSEAYKMAFKALEQEPTNKDLTCAYAKGVYDTREETATIIDKIKSEVLDNAFSVVNPKNTYEYINVLDLDSIEKIFDKYKAESEET